MIRENKAVPGIFKSVYKGFIKPNLNNFNYLKFKDNYKQHIIFCATLPKSGSSWLSNMLSSIKGFDQFTPYEWELDNHDISLETFKRYRKRLGVIKGHTRGRINNVNVLRTLNLKYIITLRDPRDKIISEYWYIKKLPGHWDFNNVNTMTLNEFINYKLESNEYKTETIDWVEEWLKNRDVEKSMIIKYEDLLADTFGIFQGIISFLDINLSTTEIKLIIDRNNFKKISGRKPGEEDTKNFLRKGIAGEWKEVFTNEQKEMFTKIGEHLIEKLGYKSTAD